VCIDGKVFIFTNHPFASAREQQKMRFWCRYLHQNHLVKLRAVAVVEFWGWDPDSPSRLDAKRREISQTHQPGIFIAYVRVSVGRCACSRSGLPMLHRSSSCMHAVATTPAELKGAFFVRFPCSDSLPRNHGGAASALRPSRPVLRSLGLRPAALPSH
jgi:hypothetical protein